MLAKRRSLGPMGRLTKRFMSGGAASAYPNAIGALTGNERVTFDTGLPGGAAPQTSSMSLRKLGTAGFGPVVAGAVVDGAAISIDVSQGSRFGFVITGTGRVITLNNPAPGQMILIDVRQDATGNRTITGWNNVLWSGGVPTLSTGANALDVFRLTYNEILGKWLGETLGKNLV